MIDPGDIRALTFDCYGTLIDWETGILGTLEPLLARHALNPGPRRLLELYSRIEPEVQREDYRPYREVLGEVTRRIARELGFEATPDEARALADSLGEWPAFAETPRVLARLAEHFRLGVLSNIDRDLFELSRRHIRAEHGFDFELVVTAQDTRSYKPAIGHFWRAMELLRLPGARILHAAESPFHDIAPAQSLGLRTAWINRRAHKGGLAASRDASIEPDIEATSLRELESVILGSP